jgi:DNA-binding NtrC family response regulator
VPLRERSEDLDLLIRHYLDKLNRQLGTSIESFSEAARERLIQYAWPGNVRELKNLVESVLVNSDSLVISVDDLPAHFRPTFEVHSERGERDQLVHALLATKWNKTKAAERLHWSRMTLYRKMAKYAISGSTSDQVA